jgi:uncharacterized membrane protein YkvA (DUF1232 family)
VLPSGLAHTMHRRIKATWETRMFSLRQDTLALYLAARHPRTPWYAKALAGFLAAYLLSPIDLIPDFVPVLGYVDDLVVISFGILVIRRLLPADVMAECRKRAAETFADGKPVSKSAAIVVVLLWIAALAVVGVLIMRAVGRRHG